LLDADIIRVRSDESTPQALDDVPPESGAVAMENLFDDDEDKIELILDSESGQHSLFVLGSDRLHDALKEQFPHLCDMNLQVFFSGQEIEEEHTVDEWRLEDGARISVQVEQPEGFYTFSSKRCHAANILLEEETTVRKADGRGDGDMADYSTTLGEAVVSTGKHQWDLEILYCRGNMRLGVAAPDLKIGPSAEQLEALTDRSGRRRLPGAYAVFPHKDIEKSWFIRSVGNASDKASRAAGKEFEVTDTCETGDVIGISVDLNEGTICFFKNGLRMCRTQTNLQGPVCLMVCMDYGQESVRIRKPEQVYV